MGSKDLISGYDVVEIARSIKDFSYSGVNSLDDLDNFDRFVLDDLNSMPSDFIKLDEANRFNKAFNNTCSQTAHYFFDIFNHHSSGFRCGALLTFNGEVFGVAKNFHKTNFLALRSFYQKSESVNGSSYSFPLIKGVAYSVNLAARNLFDEIINKKERSVWGNLEITDLKSPIGVVPSRVLLSHEVGGRLNLFEDYISKELPYLSRGSVLQKYDFDFL